MKPLFALLCLAAFSPALRAQDAAPTPPPPLPPGPLIQTRAPDPAQWVVTRKVGSLNDSASQAAPAANGQPPPPVQTMEDTFTKSGALVHLHRVTGSNVVDAWSNGVREAMVWPDGITVGVLTPSTNFYDPNPLYINFSASDFRGFDWIRLEDYTGLITYAGTKCIVYQEKSSGSDDATATIAYVALDTRLPIALQAHNWLSVYEWKQAPSEQLSVPAVVQPILNAQ